MAKSDQDLGKLVAVHGIAPAYLQRAVFIVVLSFLFFLGTMVLFYFRQNILYFILASAFLLVYLITLFSWILQRRSLVKIYESGLGYRDRSARWDEIENVGDDGSITIKNGKMIVIPGTINEWAKLLQFVRHKTDTSGKTAGTSS